MSNIYYLSPMSILSIGTEEVNKNYPEKRKVFRIEIFTNITENGFGGPCKKDFIIEFNVTEEGFKVKEKTDPIIGKLLEMIRNPLTCNVLAKITQIKDSYGKYEIEFI